MSEPCCLRSELAIPRSVTRIPLPTLRRRSGVGGKRRMFWLRGLLGADRIDLRPNARKLRLGGHFHAYAVRVAQRSVRHTDTAGFLRDLTHRPAVHIVNELVRL